MSARARSARVSARGYTIIEVMIAISLLAIAASGVIALLKVSTIGNAQAKELALATQVGRTWLERLRTDATVWNYPSGAVSISDLGDTVWLNKITGSANLWFRPQTVGLQSAAFDTWGNDVSDATVATKAQFCTHVRLTWMVPNEIMRADVRVFWPRAGISHASWNEPGSTAHYCAPDFNFSSFDTGVGPLSPLGKFHFAYFSSNILKNGAP